MSNKIIYVYLYLKKDKIIQTLKYGIKLSDYANISFKKDQILKNGLLAYISPKDSSKYFDDEYDILRIKTDKLNIYVNNSNIVGLSEKTIIQNQDICKLKDYVLGTYINPELIICSSILPENIYRYNRIIDVPLLIDNSKELYLNKEIEEEYEKELEDITFNKLRKLSNN